MGVKLAAPQREVLVLVGDGSHLMLPVDLAANAQSLGARVTRAQTVEDLRTALTGARGIWSRAPEEPAPADASIRLV